MIIAWMVYAAILGALAYAGAAAAERVVAVWSGGRRFALGGRARAATVVPAFLAAGGRTTREQLSPAEFDARAMAGTLEPRASSAAPVMPAARMKQLIGSANITRINRMLIAVDPYVRGAWLLVSGLLVALYLSAIVRLYLRSRWWREGELDGEQVLVAPDLGPAVVGLFSPRIVVPGWARSLDLRARRFMLRHEDEHVRARSPAASRRRSCCCSFRGTPHSGPSLGA